VVGYWNSADGTCSLCGEGMEVTVPDYQWSSSRTCGEIEEAGLAGLMNEKICQSESEYIEAIPCGCKKKGSGGMIVLKILKVFAPLLMFVAIGGATIYLVNRRCSRSPEPSSSKEGESTTNNHNSESPPSMHCVYIVSPAQGAISNEAH
jgi:hypothetical protein